VQAEIFDLGALYKYHFEKFTTREGALSATVKSIIFELLGLIMKKFSKLVPRECTVSQLLSTCCRVCREELEGEGKRGNQKRELTIASGALHCIELALVVDPSLSKQGKTGTLPPELGIISLSWEIGTKIGDDVYRLATLGINPPESIHKYDVPKAALGIFASHSKLFQERLLSQCVVIFNKLTQLALNKNTELRRSGVRAFDSFMKAVYQRVFLGRALY